MCDLESGIINGIGSLPRATIDDILMREVRVMGNVFSSYFMLPISWTANQLAKMAQDIPAEQNPSDFMPEALVYASCYEGSTNIIYELKVDGDLRAGYKTRNTNGPLSVSMPVFICEKDQSAEQTVALNGLADRLREDFKDAAATYSAQ